jgi:hypothetical protein
MRDMRRETTEGYEEVARSIHLVGDAINRNTASMRTFSLLPSRGAVAHITEAAMERGHDALNRVGRTMSAPETPRGVPADNTTDAEPLLTHDEQVTVRDRVHQSGERARGLTDPAVVADTVVDSLSESIRPKLKGKTYSAALKSVMLERGLQLRQR